jgi:DNA-binding MarR family transcriptional regulator
VAVLLGKLLVEIRVAFAGEDWGGLRQSHFRLLSQVPPAGISVTDLAVLLGMTKQAVGQFVTFLVESGHLEVRASPADLRVRLVVRTRLGDDTNRAVTARILACLPLMVALGWASVRGLPACWRPSLPRAGSHRIVLLCDVLADWL